MFVHLFRWNVGGLVGKKLNIDFIVFVIALFRNSSIGAAAPVFVQ